jgi:hypothetical protein
MVGNNSSPCVNPAQTLFWVTLQPGAALPGKPDIAADDRAAADRHRSRIVAPDK